MARSIARCRHLSPPNELKLSRASEGELSFTSSFIIETPSPPGSVALFPQGFAFYVSHHHSPPSTFSYAGEAFAASS